MQQTGLGVKTDVVRDWVQLYADSMFSWALHKTSSRETAEDIVQETFLAVIQSYDKFENRSHPKTWLFAILNNKITDYHRNMLKNPTLKHKEHGEKRRIELFDTLFNKYGEWADAPYPSEWDERKHLLDDENFVRTFQLCMANLPSVWNSALHLKYTEEKSGEVICQELQITPSNFWQIIHRAKLQLRKCLETKWFSK
ncbi:MAG: sigma-70 family RNA polymerase sigma factor [Flavobacteriales bacterium]|nr:sigma-70 family RNA polymerase sigma factor [Flavobacteriales bacterium]